MTFDLGCKSEKDIPIEERSSNEINASKMLPRNVVVKNHAFDVTPAELITGIITPKGVIKPDEKNVSRLFE